MFRIVALTCAVSLTGCSSTAPVSTTDESLSLVYGYFDMKDAPTKVQWVGLKQYGGKEIGTYRMGVEDGLFFHVGVEPGSTRSTSSAAQASCAATTVQLRRQGPQQHSGAHQDPGVYFLGAHRYVAHEGKFDMQPAKSPTEEEVLQRLIKQLENDGSLAQYTRQLKLARERLAQL